MDTKNKESKGSAATASKAAASKKQDEAPSPGQGATNSQNQGNGGQDLMQDAKQTASEVVNQVQQRAGDEINRQKETAASELSTVVNAVRRFGETLNNEGNGPIARFAAQYGDRAANGLDRFATYLRDQDPKRVLADVQNFGRRQPALLIGGAFLLGFAGARLIKSSMESASNGSMNTGTQRSSNTGARPAKNTGANTGAGQQPFNTGVSGAQTSTSPNRI